MTEIERAIALLKAQGYRVTKPRTRARPDRPALNAVGRPFNPHFDPNYKVKTPLTSIARLRAPMPASTPWVNGEST